MRSSRLLALGFTLFIASSLGSFLGSVLLPSRMGEARPTLLGGLAHGSKNVTITIPARSSAAEIAHILHSRGVVRDPIAFLLLVWYQGNAEYLGAGRYELDVTRLNLFELIRQLQGGKGRSDVMVVTLRPGMTNRELFAELERGGVRGGREWDRAAAFQAEFPFLRLLPPDASLQGFLFPDTYVFSEGTKTQAVLLRMLGNFETKVTRASQEANSLFSAITLASLLEKEILDPEEQEIVADILKRRLSSGIPLQVDATVCYMKSLLAPSKHCLPIKDADLNRSHPYNTYRNLGLPPGPIANPSLPAIRAALTPRPSPYWYYLSDPQTGRTIFSVTLEEHRLAKARYLER